MEHLLSKAEFLARVRNRNARLDLERLGRAYSFARACHEGQKRASGEPYFSHPLAVSEILLKMHLDSDTIIGGLLHDVVEDSAADLTQLESLFGADVAFLVGGVTKLQRVQADSSQARYAENFRNLVIAVAEDVRVLLIKLADRLHNMRTLLHVPDREKRERIARETLKIYAPLAERLSLQDIMEELVDRAFAIINPEARSNLRMRLGKLLGGEDENQNQTCKAIAHALSTRLHSAGLGCNIRWRVKRPHAIWTKMQRKHVSFSNVGDVVAFRVMVSKTDACYTALGLLHQSFPFVEGLFHDYISTPKSNWYRSVHTTLTMPEGLCVDLPWGVRVDLPKGLRVEIQIRTHAMHREAEYGVAAHWLYKESRNRSALRFAGARFRPIRELVDILENSESAGDFLENCKLDMYEDRVFCLTPGGRAIALPTGATPVDFAYAVHSEIGDTCVGCRVNGRQALLSWPLRNGDQVEIITTPGQQPKDSWQDFVVSGKAKARLKNFRRLRVRKEKIARGRQILETAFLDHACPFSEMEIAPRLQVFGVSSVEELYVLIAEEKRTAIGVLESCGLQTPIARRVPTRRLRHPAPGEKPASPPIPIRGLPSGKPYTLASCCSPLPGERIVGILVTGKGVVVHTIDCQILENFHEDLDRWVELGWNRRAIHETFSGRLELGLNNRPGALGEAASVIGKNGGNIANLHITHRSSDVFEVVVDVDVFDVTQLNEVITGLQSATAVTSVARLRG